MPQKYRFTHPRYGEIEITRNPRARRITLRARPDALYITQPTIATEKELEEALKRCGDRLVALRQQMQPATIDTSYCIEAPLFKFNIEEQSRKNFSIRYQGERATLLCPTGSSFSGNERQEWVRKIVLNAMRRRAQETLPARLQALAAQHNLHYKHVTLRDSRTRWGSCSSNGTISLNIQLVLLPTVLVDYVLLHELCHTIEMNHSERFWAKLDTLTNTNSRLLRKKLKAYNCTLP